MKIINLNGYSEDELFTWRATVYRNVVESAQTIIQTISELGVSYEKPELNVIFNYHCMIHFYLVFCFRAMLIEYWPIEYQGIQKVN